MSGLDSAQRSTKLKGFAPSFQNFVRHDAAKRAPHHGAAPARLDQLMAAFGEDRVMFGGDWPNSVGTATIPEALALMRDYFAARSRIQAEKYFWRNSQHIYRWKKRDAAQPD